MAPPPEFSDTVQQCTNVKCLANNAQAAAAAAAAANNSMTGRSVRIVGAVPKLSRLQSH